MKKFLTLCIVLLNWITLMPSALAQTNGNQTTKILVLGDSISAGYGIPTGKAWVDLLQANFNSRQKSIVLINASISGETTIGGLTRIRNLLDKHHPDIVLLELGANDALRGFKIEEIEANLQKIILSTQQYQARTILIGMKIPNNYGEKYTLDLEKMYQRLAKSNRLVFIPFLLEKFALKRELFQEDGIHPNIAAQPIIVQTVEEKLLPMMKGLKN